MPAPSFTGAKELEKTLERLAREMEKAAGAGLYAAGNNVATDSMEMTPLDTGALRGSTYVTLPVTDGVHVVTVEVGVGGPAESYAVDQHENIHNHPEGGEDHFLLKAAQKNESAMLQMVQTLMKQALEAGRAPPTPASVHPQTPQSSQKG